MKFTVITAAFALTTMLGTAAYALGQPKAAPAPRVFTEGVNKGRTIPGPAPRRCEGPGCRR